MTEEHRDNGRYNSANKAWSKNWLVPVLLSDVATMEFLRLCIDGEDVDVRLSRHEPRHVLPDVTADGKRWDGEFQLGYL